MNETLSTAETIGTEDMGPCMAFLLQFKNKGQYTCLLTHYSFSIKENKFGVFGELIQIIKYFITEMHNCLPNLKFTINDQPCLSDMYLLWSLEKIQSTANLFIVLYLF
jgi:hypothetical protein